jgi:hypothetical protein
MRLKSEHALLSTEINELNRDMLALKDIIRYKQKDLRVINKALIHKATRGPFLSVVKTEPNSQSTKTTIENSDTKFVCIQGGKCSCK